ncbi:hypothetical protein HY988_02600 [Candidatus Micrarchaeota archaeon]|nr:hypothetical protein [Candidatus Micrarchaeota archaeon]
MEELVTLIHQQMTLASAPSRIVGMYNACVDLDFAYPNFSAAEFGATFADEQSQRLTAAVDLHGTYPTRLGGGGINAALTAASLGYPASHFVGFIGVIEEFLIGQMITESGIHRIGIHQLSGPSRFNVAIETGTANKILTKPKEYLPRLQEFLDLLKSLNLDPSDWMFTGSFDMDFVLPLSECGHKLFLDTGYSYDKRSRSDLTRFIDGLKRSPLKELIVAVNNGELALVADELGAKGDLFSAGYGIVSEIASRIGIPTVLLFHDAHFATVFEPEGTSWLVPTFEISRPKIHTNAGDTFSGAFLAAYLAARNIFRDSETAAASAVAFANLAAAKRLSDRELPNPVNMKEFLRRNRMREISIAGVRTIDASQLAERMPRFRIPEGSPPAGVVGVRKVVSAR